MSIAKTYCKDLIKELDKIPVYLPGAPVKVGDIITFGSGLFGPSPIGSFDPVTNLNNLGVKYQESTSTNPHTYIYASRDGVSINFTASANASTLGDGKLNIVFSKEEATYFAAVDCDVTSMIDTTNLKHQLLKHQNAVDWNVCFIVTSITIAKKALIMQSNKKNASLTIEGDVSGLDAGSVANVNADISLRINAHNDAALLKPWSNDVTVFFTLIRFKKRELGGWASNEAGNLINDKMSMVTEQRFEIENEYKGSDFELQEVNTSDIRF